MPHTTIRLNCVIFGDASANIFSIKVEPDETVASLAASIAEHFKARFGDFPAGITLFNVSLPASEVTEIGVGDFKRKLECAIRDEGALHPLDRVHKFFPSASFREDDLHVVAQYPAAAPNTIVKKLKGQYGPLFQCLQVQVSAFGLWSDNDIKRNMNGGKILVPGHSQLPEELVKIEGILARKRTYARPPALDQWPGFRAASDPVHAQLFREIYEEQGGPSVSVKDDQEFLAFSDVLERREMILSKLGSEGSSSMKASHFTVRFIVPPFFCTSKEFEYKEQKYLGFPIFLAEKGEPELMCKFIPRPDFVVPSISFNCPFVTSEVISDLKESDKRRMLLQAIAFARAGQHLTNNGEQFFVVAIYLCANMTAERYVVAQIGKGNKVFMSRKDFNLCHPKESVSFLRQMYNLATELKELEGNFDPEREGILAVVNNAAAKMTSLTAMKKYKKVNDLVKGALDPIAEAGSMAGEPADGPSIFDADDVQAILEEMEYKIKFIPFGYPRVAVVSSVTDSSKTGFLKFVPDGGDEIEILKYLSKIDSPRNHTVAGVRFWPVRGGQVISMPAAGSWITSLRRPDAHLWSVAGQLIEAVDFMHQHGVAHLDLKPANILIPLDGGRLSIIDFNASERVDGVWTTLGGVVGTRGYIAPEAAAGRGIFSAVRADLWSCGKTLFELCDLCQPSVDRGALLQIAQALMDEDPEKRPMMSEVFVWMAGYTVDGDAGTNDLRCCILSHVL